MFSTAKSDVEAAANLAERLLDWLLREVLVASVLTQLAAVPVTFLAAWLLHAKVESLARRIPPAMRQSLWLGLAIEAALSVALPLLWFLFMLIAAVAVVKAGLHNDVLIVAVRLLLAWIVIRLVTTLIRTPGLARLVAVVVWSVAALSILGVLNALLGLLDDIALTVGKLHISVLTVLRGAFILAVLLWLASALARVLERAFSQAGNLTPSVQVLFSKVARISLLVLAFVVAMRAIGIDLTGLALFSGAIGLGLGFGLQKVVSNLVSGLILLLDRSVKPGDVIAIGATYGWVNEMGARYASVITRDGIEHLIPNEELITQRVENWSHSSNLVRMRTAIPIGYDADVTQAVALAIEAASETPRVLGSPKPVCLLLRFGENRIELELRFWINDAQNGIHNVQSDVLIGVWRKFREHGVTIPLPQRELRLREPVSVRLAPADPVESRPADAADAEPAPGDTEDRYRA